jgi:hypothetical protein
VLFTNGFKSRRQLEEHFDNHKDDFGCADENAYLLLADDFLGGPKGDTVLECIRPFDNAKIRPDHLTQALGILSSDNYIKTYYKPDPHVHMKSTNREYFKWECKRSR